jgi:putative ABC transport system permease protein
MVSTIDREKNKSLFTRIKTVDTKYPLYGSVNYEPAGAFDRMHNEPNTLLIKSKN